MLWITLKLSKPAISAKAQRMVVAANVRLPVSPPAKQVAVSQISSAKARARSNCTHNQMPPFTAAFFHKEL